MEGWLEKSPKHTGYSLGQPHVIMCNHEANPACSTFGLDINKEVGFLCLSLSGRKLITMVERDERIDNSR